MNRPNFIDDINEFVNDVEGVKKYINPNAMDEEPTLKEQINPDFLKSMVGKYLNNFSDSRQSAGRRLGFHSMNLATPLMIQSQFISSYIEQKQHQAVFSCQQAERSSCDSDKEPEQKIGKLTYAERQAKLQRYFEKKKKRNWKTIRWVPVTRYEIRKDLAEKRKRMHGRFVKSSKKSITELAKAYKGRSMASSMVSQEEQASRKSSFQELIVSMSRMKVEASEPSEKSDE